MWAILFATPFFVLFGKWSDTVGRKWIMMIGMLLAIVTYRPLFGKLLSISDMANRIELPEKKEISTTIKPIANSQNSMRVINTKYFFDDGMVMTEAKSDTVYSDASRTTLKPDVKLSKVLGENDYWLMVGIVFIMITYVTMVYGPIAAFLVEMFPTKIRYTSMSLPYHIGNGIFGGLTPFIAVLLTTIYTGDKLVGLYYPIIVAGVCFLVGLLYLRNKIDPDVND
jgi:MFS family permease